MHVRVRHHPENLSVYDRPSRLPQSCEIGMLQRLVMTMPPCVAHPGIFGTSVQPQDSRPQSSCLYDLATEGVAQTDAVSDGPRPAKPDVPRRRARLGSSSSKRNRASARPRTRPRCAMSRRAVRGEAVWSAVECAAESRCVRHTRQAVALGQAYAGTAPAPRNLSPPRSPQRKPSPLCSAHPTSCVRRTPVCFVRPAHVQLAARTRPSPRRSLSRHGQSRKTGGELDFPRALLFWRQSALF